MALVRVRSARSPNDDNGKAVFRRDELVVSLQYLRLVVGQLSRWDAQPQLHDENKDSRLGLALLSLNADAAVAHLRSEHRAWVRDAEVAAKQASYRSSDLDIVTRCLRRCFGQQFAGWVPTFGKNRVMERVKGSYVIDGGGKSGPRPVPHYVIDGGGVSRARRLKSEKTVLWRGIKPGTGARVGVVDTRLFTHPWLAGAYVAAADDLILGSAAKKLPEAADHATFVTGIILRQAPGAVVELRTGLADDGSQDSWSVARTIADLVSNSTNVVNLSLGCTTEDGQPPLVLTAALAALGPRTLVVAAAGNHGNDGSGAARPVWPAALDNVVAVGALDGSIPASFSPQAVWVDAMAQGVNVVSTSDTKRDGSVALATWSGTSFAAAAVTGAVAARIKDGRTALEAWQKLQDEYPADPAGRILIPLNALPDWPPDGLSPS